MSYVKTVIAVCLLVAFSTAAYADSAKLIKIDLDVKHTKIVRADLGIDDLYYYMDVNACVCWVSQNMGSSFSVSTFDCLKLAAHPKLEEYVGECSKPKGIIKSEEEATAPATEVKEEKKESGKGKNKSKKEEKTSLPRDDKPVLPKEEKPLSL
ncbi:MAG: hypothetical protein V1647_04840 [Pseudomonadota bacterium]